MAHLLFVPDGDHPGFFLWGAAALDASARRLERALAANGEAREAWVAGATGVSARRRGVAFGLLKGIEVLAAVPMDQVRDLPGSFGVWSAASKLALELATRGRFAPRVRSMGETTRGAAWEARWEVSLTDRRDAERFEAIARSMPAVAHGVPLEAGRPEPDAGPAEVATSGKPVKPMKKTGSGDRRRSPVWPKEALLYAFLSASIDALVRESVALRVRSSDAAEALANRSKCLHQQAGPSFQWELRFIFALVSEDQGGAALAFAMPEEQDLPNELGAWSMPAFVAGVDGVAGGGRAGKAESRVRVRMRLGGGGQSGVGGPRDRLGEGERIDLSGALRFRWEVELDGAALGVEEVRALLKRGSPPVSIRGSLTGAEEAALGAALGLVAQGSGLLPARAALRALLVGNVEPPGLPMPAEVVADRALAACLDSLSGRGEGRTPELSPELWSALGEARSPKLERGLAWLSGRVSLGLGGWFVEEDEHVRRLAAIALLLHIEERKPKSARLRRRGELPPLVISANPVAWEAAVARAAPPLVPALHHGPERAKTAADLKARSAGRGLVLTSFGELASDADLLSAVEWPLILFDELDELDELEKLDKIEEVEETDSRAGSTSAWSSVAQGLRARCRIGLAGEGMNRCLNALWDALELVSPGLLGPLDTFRREIAVPVERFRDPEAEALMARVVRLFVFRAGSPTPESAAGAPVDQASAQESAREEVGG
jgi:hypothetical protein